MRRDAWDRFISNEPEPEMTAEQQDVFAEGARARKIGEPLSHNPYHLLSQTSALYRMNKRLWSRGWADQDMIMQEASDE